MCSFSIKALNCTFKALNCTNVIGNKKTYMSNTVESTLFVRMEWIRNLIRISDSTAFVSMLSNLLQYTFPESTSRLTRFST